MTTLEDRLRRELPELADALMPAHPAVTDPTADPTIPVIPAIDHAIVESPPPRGYRIRRSLVAAAAAVVVAAVGIGLAVDRFGGAGERTRVDAAAPRPADFGSWTAIPDGPITPRPFAMTAWTGSEAVFWAGSNLDRSFAYIDGAAYDPSSNSWRKLAVPGWGHPGLTSAFFDGELYALAKGGGTRFDPSSGTWTDLPQVDGMFLAATVASDDAVWGLGPAASNPTGQADLAIARYEPASDSWVQGRAYDGPIENAAIVQGLARLETSVLWTGSEIVVWHGTDGGLAYDPTSQRWRSIESPVSPEGATGHSIAALTSAGLTLLAEVEGVDGPVGAAAVLTDSGWNWLDAQIPFNDFESVTVAGAGDWLVAFSSDQPPVVIHVSTGSWSTAVSGPLGGLTAPNTAWTGSSLLVWGGVGDQAAGATGAIWTPPRS